MKRATALKVIAVISIILFALIIEVLEPSLEIMLLMYAALLGVFAAILINDD